MRQKPGLWRKAEQFEQLRINPSLQRGAKACSLQQGQLGCEPCQGGLQPGIQKMNLGRLDQTTELVATPGGQVVAGQANISQSAATLNVNQSSNRAAIDWGIGKLSSRA